VSAFPPVTAATAARGRVWYGPKADMTAAVCDARFTPESGQSIYSTVLVTQSLTLPTKRNSDLILGSPNHMARSG
jgi:hypothetical protein